MFEFKISYLQPGYHKPGEAPFTFPPEGMPFNLNSNLIEIQGRNGTGKTTLLNVLALALGFLNHEKELSSKPILRHKLEDLETNPTLEYYFRIRRENPQPVDIIMERRRGQEAVRSIGSKPVSLETLDSQFDIVFLTEDDPSKIITQSCDKLGNYFMDLDKRLLTLGKHITNHLLEIAEFNEIEAREMKLNQEITNINASIDVNRSLHKSLEGKLEQLRLREAVNVKLDLLNDEDQISLNYQNLRKTYQGLVNKDDDQLASKIRKERSDLTRIEREIRDLDLNILSICSSLATYGVTINSDRLIKHDYTEFNRLMEKIAPSKEDDATTIRMVDEMIGIFNKYSEGITVPLIDKSVKETLRELYHVKVKHSSDRVFALAKQIQKLIEQKKWALKNLETVQERIAKNQQIRGELIEVPGLEGKLAEAEKRYLALQAASRDNRTQLLDQWQQLKGILGTAALAEKQLDETLIKIKAEESLKSRYEDNLKTLLENKANEPKYQANDEALRDLDSCIPMLRERLYQWSEILHQQVRGSSVTSNSEKGSDTESNENSAFINAVGEYLGEQFEPILFDGKTHKVKFFDIRRATFITDSERQIPIATLSQGQSKVASLTGVFRKMDPNKKKIVLVDEIADLDPCNLQNVKQQLRSKYDDGSLLLALLVRPTQSTSGTVEVNGWV